MTTPAPQPPPDPVRTSVFALIHTLVPDRLGTGPMAELRRMEPAAGVLPPAFWRVLMKHVPDDLCQGRDAERAWAAIIHGIALMAPRAHEAQAWPGRVLAETGYSEPRFVRLLRAEADGLPVETRTVCRWLATKARPIDWGAFARFLLSRLHPRFNGDNNSKEQTDRMARAFFTVRAKDTSSPETSAP